MFSLLHIDQNFFYKNILHKLSLEQDFSYYSAKSPQSAYEILKNHAIDIIITGLEFEEESEEPFIQHLIDVKAPQTPIVVLTALDDIALKTRLFELGITDFITKDHFLDYLGDLIAKLEKNDLILHRIQTLDIAIIDDNETHLRIVKDTLYRYGISKVTCFNHPQKLIDAQKNFDIYFVDCIMPGLTGEQLICKIRTKDEYAVIIAMSTLGSHTVATGVLIQGANDFISKPFSENELLARLKANVRTYTLLQNLKEKNAILERLAQEDGLTGLYNHKAIMDLLDREIDRCKRYQTSLSILMFDIDRFKVVNDTYGHHIGDVVLSDIGKIWSTDSRRTDVAGRYGGEEFVVILPNTDITGARIYAERLRKDIENMVFSKQNVKITISGGLAQYKGETQTAEDLIQVADKNLYIAKNNGRNRIFA